MATAFPEDGRRGRAGGTITRQGGGEEDRSEGRSEDRRTHAHEDATHRRRELAGQAGGIGGTRTLEDSASRGRVAPGGGRCARRFHAWAVIDVDARANQPATRSGGDPAGTGDAGPGRRSDARVAISQEQEARQRMTQEGSERINPTTDRTD